MLRIYCRIVAEITNLKNYIRMSVPLFLSAYPPMKLLVPPPIRLLFCHHYNISWILVDIWGKDNNNNNNETIHKQNATNYEGIVLILCDVWLDVCDWMSVFVYLMCVQDIYSHTTYTHGYELSYLTRSLFTLIFLPFINNFYCMDSFFRTIFY